MVQQDTAKGVASASSNYPLRAGKATLFQGGVRGVSFVTGGKGVGLPDAARGTVKDGLLQHVDVSATLAALGGATDAMGQGLDGFNVWDYVTSSSSSSGGSSSSSSSSPRTEVPLNIDTSILGGRNFSALIQGNMKLINGHASTPSIPYDGYWSNDPYTRTDPPQERAGRQARRQDRRLALRSRRGPDRAEQPGRGQARRRRQDARAPRRARVHGERLQDAAAQLPPSPVGALPPQRHLGPVARPQQGGHGRAVSKTMESVIGLLV